MRMPLSEGARLFFGELADRRAAQELWKLSIKDVPESDDPDAIRRYYRAWLTAQTVRFEVYDFLAELFVVTWWNAARAVFPGARMVSHSEAVRLGFDEDEEYQLISWLDGNDLEDGVAYGALIKLNGRFYLAGLLFFDPVGHAGVGFYLLNSEGSQDHTQRLKLPDDWDWASENEVFTKLRVLGSPVEADFDAGEMSDAAMVAVAAVAQLSGKR